jgi:hypothetical protein
VLVKPRNFGCKGLDWRFNGRGMKKGSIILLPKPLEARKRDSDEVSANVIIYMGKLMVNIQYNYILLVEELPHEL